MEFFEAVRRRQSIRKFKPGDVPREDVQMILDAGRLAPSGANKANREFIVIRDAETIEALTRVQPAFEHVPVVIAVVMDTTPTKYGSYWVEDCSAAVENMLLAATALGYGSVWVEGTLKRHEEWAKELLGVPEDKRLYVLLPIGHPAEPGPRASKPELRRIVHYERYT
jgi:nitroreductase